MKVGGIEVQTDADIDTGRKSNGGFGLAEAGIVQRCACDLQHH